MNVCLPLYTYTCKHLCPHTCVYAYSGLSELARVLARSIYPGAWIEHPTAGVTRGEVRVSQLNWKPTGKSEIIVLDETKLHEGEGQHCVLKLHIKIGSRKVTVMEIPTPRALV